MTPLDYQIWGGLELYVYFYVGEKMQKITKNSLPYFSINLMTIGTQIKHTTKNLNNLEIQQPNG